MTDYSVQSRNFSLRNLPKNNSETVANEEEIFR